MVVGGKGEEGPQIAQFAACLFHSTSVWVYRMFPGYCCVAVQRSQTGVSKLVASVGE